MIRRLKCAVCAVAIAAAHAALAQSPALASAPAAEDSLSEARGLYAAAAYEEALAILDRLRATGQDAHHRVIEQYRAFCLLALGRSWDAELAIEAIITAEPLYRPSDEEISPRLLSAFSDVRRRMLPIIIRTKYATAKAAFDRSAFGAAADGFKDVLNVLADPDVGAAASQPPLSDLRTLAAGFYDLSATAAAPPPPSPSPLPPALPAPPPPPSPPPVYAAGHPGLVPPVTIVQALPPYPTKVTRPLQGAVEVVIDEAGRVGAATMTRPLSPVYDRQALAAARQWQYEPATLDGVPVRFRKTVLISIRD